jgi:ribosomal protein S18 acetylase RimI-like enzyme
MSTLSTRFYTNEADLQQMQTLLMEARARSDDWRYPHVGDLNWSFFLVASQLDPRTHVRLWHAGEGDAGKLIGYAILGVDPLFDVQVLPEYAWAGIEAEGLAWAEDLRLALSQVDPPRWRSGLATGARQDDAHRIAFLEQSGFRRGSHVEVNMLRLLPAPIGAASVPAPYELRAVAGSVESAARAAAERAVWGQWSTGAIDGGDYTYLMRMAGYRRDLDIVAVTADGVIAAYVNGWLDELNHIGDLGPVGALPAHRRQGLTRAVLLECMRRMQTYGMDRVCVSTGESNVPALGLYQSLGFTVVNRYFEYTTV